MSGQLQQSRVRANPTDAGNRIATIGNKEATMPLEKVSTVLDRLVRAKAVTITVDLTQDESCLILKAYNLGLGRLSEWDMAKLDVVIQKLSDQIQ
jgi:hypothetical protein